jgi:hypothetical protein
MTEGGLAKTTKAIQLGDELVEVDGTSVKVEWTREITLSTMSRKCNSREISQQFRGFKQQFCNFPKETEIYEGRR